MLTLSVGERVAAFGIVLEGATRWCFYLAAYRQEFKNAGSALLARLVEGAHDAGCTSLSLLRGDLHYKYDWANESEDATRLCALPTDSVSSAPCLPGALARCHFPLIQRVRSVLLRTGDRR